MQTHHTTKLDALSGISGPVSPTQLSLVEIVKDALYDNPDFNRTLFKSSDSRVAQVIDFDFREQLVRRAIAEATKLAASKTNLNPSSDLNEQAFTIVDKYLKLRSNWYDLWRRCKDLTVFPTYGSANDDAWSAKHERFAEILCQSLVESGISNINGGSRTGTMGKVSFLMRRFIDAAENAQKNTKAKIINVLLHFFGESREIPNEWVDNEFKSEAMRGFQSRTSANLSLGIQKGAGFWHGGLGSIEENIKWICEVCLKDRVQTSTHESHTLTQKGFFFNDTLKGKKFNHLGQEVGEIVVDHFWDPMQNQIEYLKSIGGIDPKKAPELIFTDINDPEAVANKIVEHYKTSKLKENQSSTKLSDLEQSLADEVFDTLSKLPEFIRSAFNDKEPDLVHLIDAQYKAQVLFEARELAVKAYQEKIHASVESGQARIDSINEAIKKGQRWRYGLQKLHAIVKDKPTTTVFAPNRDDFWNERLQNVTQEWVKVSVARGENIVIGGNGDGAAHAIFSIWAKEMAAYKIEHGGRNSDSQLVRVQCKIEGTTKEARELWGFKEILAPPLGSLITKTPVLATLGKAQRVLVYPGTIYELEAAATALLANQLRDKVHTVYTHQEKAPEIIFLSTKFNNTDAEPFSYQYFEKQLNVCVSTECAALKNFLTTRFVDITSNNAKSIGQVIGRNLALTTPTFRKITGLME